VMRLALGQAIVSAKRNKIFDDCVYIGMPWMAAERCKPKAPVFVVSLGAQCPEGVGCYGHLLVMINVVGVN